MTRLPFDIVDAEYSDYYDALIAVSGDEVHLYDPWSNSHESVELPTIGVCISVSPDGMTAAVGHDAFVSIIDLEAMVVDQTLPVTCDVLDIVLAGNGYVYAFPRSGQWESIRCLEIATGTETLSTGPPIYAGTLARLHPNGKAIYGADRGLSPQDIEKYDIQGGTAAYLYDSPYHGDYSAGAPLWISEDGLRIITRSGTTYRASEVQANDMTYAGTLSEIGSLQWAVHSVAAEQILAIPLEPAFDPLNEDIEIVIYNSEYLGLIDRLNLPEFQVGEGAFLSHGRFVFFNSDGTRFAVVVKADETSGLVQNQFGIVLYDVMNE